jgi:hypothetical protein
MVPKKSSQEKEYISYVSKWVAEPQETTMLSFNEYKLDKVVSSPRRGKYTCSTVAEPISFGQAMVERMRKEDVHIGLLVVDQMVLDNILMLSKCIIANGYHVLYITRKKSSAISFILGCQKYYDLKRFSDFAHTLSDTPDIIDL